MAKITMTVIIDGQVYTAKQPKFEQYRAYIHYLREKDIAIKERTTDDLDAELELVASLFADPAVTAKQLKELTMVELLELRGKYAAFIAQDIPESAVKNG